MLNFLSFSVLGERFYLRNSWINVRIINGTSGKISGECLAEPPKSFLGEFLDESQEEFLEEYLKESHERIPEGIHAILERNHGGSPGGTAGGILPHCEPTRWKSHATS